MSTAFRTSAQILNSVYDDAGALNVSATIPDAVTVTLPSPTAPQAYGYDATGQDAYATILTATAERHHLKIANYGANPVVISVDSGVTDAYYLTGGEVNMIDDLLIANGATVKAKNGSAGNNYTNLYISIW